MTSEVVTVTQNTPVHEAMRIILDNPIAGLPVVDEEGVLMGMVTEKDMLQLMYRSNLGGMAVSDIMTHDIVSFGPDDDVNRVCKCFMEHAFKRVPITSEGRVVGVVSRRDIIRFIVDLAAWGESINPNAPLV